MILVIKLLSFVGVFFFFLNFYFFLREKKTFGIFEAVEFAIHVKAHHALLILGPIFYGLVSGCSPLWRKRDYVALVFIPFSYQDSQRHCLWK